MQGLDNKFALDFEDEVCRQNISWFVRRGFSIVAPGSVYKHNWHIDCIAEHLHAVYNGEIKRLIINIEPRSLKSLIISVMFPAWILGRNSSSQIICASYAQGLAEKLSVDTRLIMESDWYKAIFPNTALSADQNQKKKFITTDRGFRFATSVGGTVTGEGGEFLLMDDPIKPDEGLSEVVRNYTNTWFDQVFMTRFNNPKTSAAVLIMQRVHENDLTAHLLEKGGWYNLSIPTIAEKKTIIEIGKFKKIREEGELLHAEREGEEEVETKRKAMGTYGFAGQCQQRPTPLGGGEFKLDWLVLEDVKLKGLNRYIIVDPAGGKKGSQKKDYTSMIVVGCGADKIFRVLDIVRDRELNLQGRQRKLFELVAKWSPLWVGYESFGMLGDLDYIKEKQDEQNFRFTVKELKGTRLSKEDRIRKLIPLFMDGRIILPEYGFYVTNNSGEPIDLVRAFVEDEYSKFPVSKNDDMIDALSRILDDDMGIIYPRHSTVEKRFVSSNKQSYQKAVWF